MPKFRLNQINLQKRRKSLEFYLQKKNKEVRHDRNQSGTSLQHSRFFMQISNLKAFHRFVNAILAKNREKCRTERVHFAASTPQVVS